MTMNEDSVREPPSAEAAARYPHTYGYNYEINPEGEPCTCNGCKGRCAGDCGCKACSDQFLVFCDEAGFLGPGELIGERERRALNAYKFGKHD